MTTIYSLCYQSTPSDQDAEPYHYVRIPVQSVNLVAGHGIEGDLKAGHNPNRQLNVMSLATVLELREEGYKSQPGELGEQITISGLNIVTLPAGTQLQFGDSAVIEVVSSRTGCDWFAKIQGKAKENTVGRLGVMARVVASGTVHIGDEVRVLETSAAPTSF